jgi:hypothetical protein
MVRKLPRAALVGAMARSRPSPGRQSLLLKAVQMVIIHSCLRQRGTFILFPPASREIGVMRRFEMHGYFA